mmetsp:Transcript_23687/g.56077  ORF Transcript_23687/g.56077 Transcript_23687/m.56077 type:complete len:217 (-) Transcript_23687:344-994(-)
MGRPLLGTGGGRAPRDEPEAGVLPHRPGRGARGLVRRPHEPERRERRGCDRVVPGAGFPRLHPPHGTAVRPVLHLHQGISAPYDAEEVQLGVRRRVHHGLPELPEGLSDYSECNEKIGRDPPGSILAVCTHGDGDGLRRPALPRCLHEEVRRDLQQLHVCGQLRHFGEHNELGPLRHAGSPEWSDKFTDVPRGPGDAFQRCVHSSSAGLSLLLGEI